MKLLTLTRKFDYGLLVALLLPLFAVMPLLLYRGLPNTADGPVHLMRQVQLNEAWAEGNLYPRWGTDLAFGHGMPIFSYAPPSLYYLTQVFHLVGLPLDEAMKSVLVLDFLLYSVAMFLFVRRIFGTSPALLAAAVYVYAPYRLREAFIQGNYGQFTGLACYPLIFWAFHGLITEGKPRFYILAPLALASLLLSHNISAMLFAPIFAAYLVFLLLLNAEFRLSVYPLLRTIYGGSLGLGLAAIFWLPAFGERHDIKLEGITQGFFDFRENFITLPELMSLPVPLDVSAINPEYPLSLGLAQIVGAVLGFVALGLAFRRLGEAWWHGLFFALGLLAYAFFALPISQPVWEAVPLLDLAEFPWRMLGPAIFCAAVLAGFGLYGLGSRPVYLGVGLALTIGVNAYYLYPSQFIEWGTPGPADAFAYEVVSGAIGTTSTGEFLPRWAQQHPDPETLWPDYEAGRMPRLVDPASLPIGATAERISHLAESDTVTINTPAAFEAVLYTLYWPGWTAYLNGQPVAIDITDDTGLMQVAIPPGRHQLTIQLEATPLRTIGLWLSVGSVGGLLLVGLWAMTRRVGTTRTADESLSPRLAGMLAAALVAGYLISRPMAPWFTLQSDPNAPQLADRVLGVDFADEMRLVGADALPDTVSSPGELTAVVYWRTLHEVDINYAVFLHLNAPNGETVAIADERHPENIPTRNWPPGLYVRNPLHLEIPAGVPPIQYDVAVGVYDRDTGTRLPTENGTTHTLGRVWVTVPEPSPGDVLVRFGEDITLHGVDISAEQITLSWRTESRMAGEYSIFVHFLDESGAVIAQADGVPYDGLYPLARWRPGQLIIDPRPRPSVEAARVAVGVYSLADGTRLPAHDGNTRLPNDSYIIPLE